MQGHLNREELPWGTKNPIIERSDHNEGIGNSNEDSRGPVQ